MALSDNTKGALLMMGSMAAFTFNDALMKSLAGDVPLVQAIFLRGLVASALMVSLAAWQGALRLKLSRQDGGLLALRTAMEIAAVFLFLSALFNMPIANATAILQALPLTVTLAAAVLFGEAIGWRRAVAIGVGFFGVLLIVRPGTEGFTIYSLYALGAVVVVTARDLAVRRMSGALPSVTVATYAALGVTVAAGIVSFTQPWVTLTLPQVLTLAAAALCLMMAYFLSVAVMRMGEIAVVSPFRYTAIVFALILGVAAFGERPDAITLSGAALVVATGLYTLWRERVVAASRASDAV
ncbi:MAG: DMT family transporter [Pseudomonadota bacterium]